jgi:hypothetical protein
MLHQYKSLKSTNEEMDILMDLIKCADNGEKVLLFGVEKLYDCLYDLLNMSHSLNTSVQSRSEDSLYFCTLSMGNYSRRCRVSRDFKAFFVVTRE